LQPEIANKPLKELTILKFQDHSRSFMLIPLKTCH